MRISFDIDDTLVCHFPTAVHDAGRFPAFIHQRFGEPLRKGARAMIQHLKQRGFSIWIYTTSERTPFQIRCWLWLYRIKVDGIVNAARHRDQLAGRRFARMPSKYPPAFGIDLHVDDSEGVRMEGDEHGFRVAVVSPQDEHWVDKILGAVNQTESAATPK